MYTTWNCPLADGSTSEELVLAFDQGRKHRLLLIPALFDEANKLRRMAVEVMRRLDRSGVDCFLPDWPGCNESRAKLPDQSLESWRVAAASAAAEFQVTHLLSLRAGALLAPEGLPGWRYAPTGGRQVLRAMLRARTISAKEAGREETMDSLQELGRAEGVELAGWPLGPAMFSQLEGAKVPDNPLLMEIEQSSLGGAGLWLRAEPGEDHEQADALAAIVAISLLEGNE